MSMSWYPDRETVAKALQHQRKERSVEVDGVIQQLKRLNRDDVIKTTKYYPIRFLTDGVEAYINVFDNATVYYTGLAIEIALIQSLGVNHLARQRRMPGFKALIEIASEADILDTEHKEKANCVRQIRNIYTHYFNVMLNQVHTTLESKQNMLRLYPALKHSIETDFPEDERQIMMEMVDIIMSHSQQDTLISDRCIPYDDVPFNDEAFTFIKNRVEEHANWLTEFPHDEAITIYRWHYGSERRDALECLQSTSDILTHLGFLI